MATLKSLVDETTNIKASITNSRDALKQILTDMEVTNLGSVKSLSTLINKVKTLENPNASKLWLYKDGNEYADITGGFGVTWVDTYGAGTTCNMYSDRMEIVYVVNDGNYKAGAVSMKKAIDFTPYKKLNIIYSSQGFGELYLSVANGTGVGTDMIAHVSIKSQGDNLSASVDVSSINATKYLKFYGWGVSNRTSKLTVYKIWLEK